MSNNETILKIIILGSSEVGKTSILNRYFNNEFKQNLLSTIGIDFKTKYFKFDEEKVKFNFIDTAGQEKFRAISVNYLKGTNGVILVYDITNKETFDLIRSWIQDINDNNKSNIGKVLLGNKLDLEEKRDVLVEDAEELAKELNCKHFEVSAKTGEGVNEALDEIARISYHQYKDGDKRNSIRLSACFNNDVNVDEKKKKCC
jgi:small GTP-binding protein